MKPVRKKSLEQITKGIMLDYPCAEVNPKALTHELNQAIHLAKIYHQPSAMVAAIKAKAQLYGFLKDTHVVEGTVNHNHDVKVRRVDLDERSKQIAEERLSDALS